MRVQKYLKLEKVGWNEVSKDMNGEIKDETQWGPGVIYESG